MFSLTDLFYPEDEKKLLERLALETLEIASITAKALVTLVKEDVEKVERVHKLTKNLKYSKRYIRNIYSMIVAFYRFVYVQESELGPTRPVEDYVKPIYQSVSVLLNSWNEYKQNETVENLSSFLEESKDHINTIRKNGTILLNYTNN